MLGKYQSLTLTHNKKLKIHISFTHSYSFSSKMYHFNSRLVTQMLGKYQSLIKMLNKLKRHMSLNHTLLYSNICVLNSRLVI